MSDHESMLSASRQARGVEDLSRDLVRVSIGRRAAVLHKHPHSINPRLGNSKALATDLKVALALPLGVARDSDGCATVSNACATTAG
jgi:hypothetical protein